MYHYRYMLIRDPVVTGKEVGNEVSNRKRPRSDESVVQAVGDSAPSAPKRFRTGELPPVDTMEPLRSSPTATDSEEMTNDKCKPGLVEVKHPRRKKPVPSEPVRRSTRLRRPNVRLHGYTLETYFIATADELPKSMRATLAGPDRDKWMEAMQVEFDSIMANETWILVNRPPATKIMSSCWVFVIKRNQQGEVERYKARLTIRGFEQVFGLDYWEVYSPVVSMEAVRVVIMLALYYDLELRHVDFTTAFLNGTMDVEVYMEQPAPFKDGSGRVCLHRLFGTRR